MISRGDMISLGAIALGDERMARLDRLARDRRSSRSALVREAVDKLLDENGHASRMRALDAVFGLWKKHGFDEDGLDYQRRIRAEWDREWDPD